MSQPIATRESDEMGSGWQLHGFATGVIGASVVALVYLVIDLAGGRPLWTPNALGAALFRGEALLPGAPIEPVLVLGYTAAHGTVFVGFAMIAAFEALGGIRRLSSELAGAALAAAVLFAAFEITFELFGWLLPPGDELIGGIRAIAANGLAAIAMAGYLGAVRSRPAR